MAEVKGVEVERIRNVGIIAHGGAGKTSLTEALLFHAGAIDRLGRVEEGTSTMDFEPEEVSRKITITAAVGFCDWKGHRFHLIDTPGYLNFVEDAKGCLRAADGAVVLISAISGVKAETEKVWAYACQYELPRIAFVNKMDRERADFYRAVGDMEQSLTREALPVQVPIGAAETFEGVVDLLTLKALFFTKDGSGKVAEGPIPDSVRKEVETYRKRLVERIAETDDALLERYLEAGDLEEAAILKGLREGTLTGKFVPVLCGSATKNMGVRPLLDGILTCLPSPADRARIVPIRGQHPKSGDSVTRQPSPADPFSAFVFKTIVDPFMGKLTLFRVFSGQLASDSGFFNASQGKRERCGQIFLQQGKKHVPVPVAAAGQIAAVAKLKETQTGDTLCDEAQPILFERIVFAEPVMAFAISPKTKGDEDKVSAALARILEEDPTLRFHRDDETKEMILAGMGQTHLEVTLERLKRKFGVEVVMNTPKVPYKETIKGAAKAQGKYKKQSGGRGQYGDCRLEVESLPRGGGFEFVDKIVGGVIPRQYIPAVEKGVVEAMHEGVVAGYPLIDLRVTLYDGSFHTVDSSEMAFKISGSMALKKAVQEARPVLLEPIMNVEVIVPEDALGGVIGDLNSKRGRVVGVIPQAHSQKIAAQVPMAEMLKYAPTLNSLTSGRGMYSMEFSHYEEVPSHFVAKITAAKSGKGQ